MQASERDDLIHVIDSTLGFYGKKIDRGALKFWLSALRGHPFDQVDAAFAEHVRIGKYAPKPVDILDIIGARRQRQAARASHESDPHTPCPAHIDAAWRWFIPMMASGSKNLDGVLQYNTRDLDLETQDKYLLTVNQEAMAQNMPEAIPDEFKLKEVWG